MNIDRIDTSRRKPIPAYLKFAVLLLIFVGIGIHNCSQTQMVKSILITDVRITEVTRVSIDVSYQLYNISKVERTVNLMLKVFDTKGELLGSSLYQVTIPPGVPRPMLRQVNKLTRPLLEGEKPGKVTLEVFKRKIL